MDDCVFCKIVDQKLPSYKVWEDDKFMAFLSIHPIKTGHTLVIPKKHQPYIFDIDNEDLTELTKASKKVAKKLESVFKPASGKVGVAVYGIDVDHTHVHLVPIDKPGDLNLAHAKPASKEDLESTHKRIVGDR